MLINALPAGSRPGAAMQDFFLSVQLGMSFVIWLRDRHLVTARSKPFYILYATILLGAAVWCGFGVYIHLLEPLPTERTLAWIAFLEFGAVTPILYPLLSALAFAKEAPTFERFRAAYVATGILGCCYTALAVTGVDLSCGGLLPTSLQVTPWHAADGRSYGGREHDIKFDLLSSFPCWRGDSLFVLSSMFLAMNSISTLILFRASRQCIEELRTLAWWTMFSTGSMLFNCIVLLYLVVVFQVKISTAFDVFHAGQLAIMAHGFFCYRRVLHHDSIVKMA